MRWATLAVLFVLAAASAGCLSNLQRAGLTTVWDAEAELVEGPVLDVDEWPSMLVVEGIIDIEAAERVELTAVVGGLKDENGSMPLRPVLLTIGDQTIHPGESRDDPVYMRDGDAVRATFVPGATAHTRVAIGAPQEVSVELRWRYSEGDRFDAGRFEFEQNVTVTAAPSVGIGATEVRDGRVRAVVFESFAAEPVAREAEVTAYTVRSRGVEELSPMTATFEQGEGVLIGALQPNLGLPDGEGYLVLLVRGQGIEGAAVTPLVGGEERTPAPGVLAFFIVACAAALIVRRRA